LKREEDNIVIKQQEISKLQNELNNLMITLENYETQISMTRNEVGNFVY
jgi:hypothetical protein